MLRFAADSRPGNKDGRMILRSSLIGLATVQWPPPNGAASRSLMNDQFTASFSPRAAARRFRRRSSFWLGEAVGAATPGARGNGVEGS